MKVIGAVTIGELIEAHYEKDEQKIINRLMRFALLLQIVNFGKTDFKILAVFR